MEMESEVVPAAQWTIESVVAVAYQKKILCLYSVRCQYLETFPVNITIIGKITSN
jgi:hypothetical protein